MKLVIDLMQTYWPLPLETDSCFLTYILFEIITFYINFEDTLVEIEKRCIFLSFLSYNVFEYSGLFICVSPGRVFSFQSCHIFICLKAQKKVLYLDLFFFLR